MDQIDTVHTLMTDYVFYSFVLFLKIRVITIELLTEHYLSWICQNYRLWCQTTFMCLWYVKLTEYVQFFKLI